MDWSVSWTDASFNTDSETGSKTHCRNLFNTKISDGVKGLITDVLLVNPEGDVEDSWGT